MVNRRRRVCRENGSYVTNFTYKVVRTRFYVKQRRHITGCGSSAYEVFARTMRGRSIGVALGLGSSQGCSSCRQSVGAVGRADGGLRWKVCGRGLSDIEIAKKQDQRLDLGRFTGAGGSPASTRQSWSGIRRINSGERQTEAIVGGAIDQGSRRRHRFGRRKDGVI